MVIMPSRIDNLPNACMEAMALGKTVMASTNASFEELLDDGVSGFLFENGDVDDLASAVSHVWHGADLEQVGRRAMRKIRELSPERILPKFESYIRRCCEKRHTLGAHEREDGMEMSPRGQLSANLICDAHTSRH